MSFLRRLAFWRTRESEPTPGGVELEPPFDGMWQEILAAFAASEDAGLLVFQNIVKAYGISRAVAAVRVRDSEWAQKLAEEATRRASVGAQRKTALLNGLAVAPTIRRGSVRTKAARYSLNGN